MTRALVAIAAVGMTIAGCSGSGDEADRAAEASASADDAAEAEAEAKAALARKKAKATAARTSCARDLEPLLVELSEIDSRLNVGLDPDEFGDYVGDASVAYDRVTSNRVSISCSSGAGLQLENALSEYIDANSAWQDCIQNVGCVVEGAVLDGIRAHWSEATLQIDSATRTLASNRAYFAGGGEQPAVPPQTPADSAPLRPYIGSIFTVEVIHVDGSDLQVQFCATAPYAGGSIPVTRARWSVRGDDGMRYPALPDDIQGGYPVETSLDVGQCARGAVPLALPPGVSIARVEYESTLGETSWAVS